MWIKQRFQMRWKIWINKTKLLTFEKSTIKEKIDRITHLFKSIKEVQRGHYSNIQKYWWQFHFYIRNGFQLHNYVESMPSTSLQVRCNLTNYCRYWTRVQNFKTGIPFLARSITASFVEIWETRLIAIYSLFSSRTDHKRQVLL